MVIDTNRWIEIELSYCEEVLDSIEGTLNNWLKTVQT